MRNEQPPGHDKKNPQKPLLPCHSFRVFSRRSNSSKDTRTRRTHLPQAGPHCSVTTMIELVLGQFLLPPCSGLPDFNAMDFYAQSAENHRPTPPPPPLPKPLQCLAPPAHELCCGRAAARGMWGGQGSLPIQRVVRVAWISTVAGECGLLIHHLPI